MVLLVRCIEERKVTKFVSFWQQILITANVLATHFPHRNSENHNYRNLFKEELGWFLIFAKRVDLIPFENFFLSMLKHYISDEYRNKADPILQGCTFISEMCPLSLWFWLYCRRVSRYEEVQYIFLRLIVQSRTCLALLLVMFLWEIKMIITQYVWKYPVHYKFQCVHRWPKKSSVAKNVKRLW